MEGDDIGNSTYEEILSLTSIFNEIEVNRNRSTGHTSLTYGQHPNTITVTITANYPNELPDISVPDHLISIGLLANLMIVATPFIGNPMLYTIFDAAKDWLAENKDKIERSLNSSKKSGTVCKFFSQGKCRFGVHCINIHPGVSTGSDSKNGSESDSKNGAETWSTVPKSKNKQKDSKKDSPSPSKYSQNSTAANADDGEEEKKERMRTATEVISRILWDPDLPSEDFTVGYLDRFIGIQEKAFKEFSWEDIATVGADVLAVPKHRIQYFKYKGEIVWDKRVQMDNVFGSRGGKTIDMIVGAHDSNKDKQQDGEQQQQETESDQGNEAYELDLIGNDGEEDRPLAHRHGNQPRPTHFVCLRITDEEVKARVKKVIDHVIKLNPQLADGVIKPPSLHVTLCMVQLRNEEELEKARQVFKSFQLQFLSLLPRCVKVKFTGVDNFRERLIYVKMEPLPGMSKLVYHMIEQFQLAGLQTPGNHDEYTPHITLIKLSRPMQKTLDTKLINPECYRPFLSKNLGCQTVVSVHLCNMHGPSQPDGFYLKQATITNSLLGLPRIFIQLVEDKLNQLKAQGYLESDLIVDQLHDGVSQNNETLFDSVIEELMRVCEEFNTTCGRSEEQERSVIIMRGLPGSGKSHLSSHCLESLNNPSQVAVISADQFFSQGGSEYHFDPVKAFKAHQECISKFLQAFHEQKKLVIIDNTNTQLWEYVIYSYLCEVLDIRCHILEIPCTSPSIAERFRNRNQHNIQSAAIKNMMQRWEEDKRAVVVPPSLAYPKDWAAVNPQPFSINELCKGLYTPLPEAIKKCNSLVAVYSGVFLTSRSQWEVLSSFPPTHSEIHSSHVTLVFNPNTTSLKKLPIGKNVMVKIVGHAANAKSQACVVEVPLPSENKTPHITVSTAEGVPPKSTNIMLQNQVIKNCDTMMVKGTVGVVIRQATEEEVAGEEAPGDKIACMPYYVVTSLSDFKEILPRFINDSESEVTKGTSADADTAGIVTDRPEKITKLFVFDFDGTLCIPPGPIDGRRKYEQEMGKKWPHRGWLSWAESLLPPLRVFPGPALAEFRSHFDRAGSRTIILTGRAESTKPGLLKVLENLQISPNNVHFKPNITDEATFAFKHRTIEHLLAKEYPDVTLVKFWDDMPENLWAINHLSSTPSVSHIQFDIIDANKMASALSVSKHGKKIALLQWNPDVAPAKTKHESILQEHLFLYGFLPSPEYQVAVQEGIEFIADQFGKVLGYEGNPLHLVYPFGSYPLKRVSDVDLCLIAPNSQSNIEWIEKMAAQLQSCGVKYVHVGHSSRCPRLKLMLFYSNTAPIEYDIVVAVVPKDEKLFSEPSSFDEQLPIAKVASMRRSGDNVSKVALSGPVFLSTVEEALNKFNVSRDVLGAVVEMIVQILIAKREKGNAYHCIRTFHIVQLLLEFIQQNGATLPSSSTNCDTLFKQFLGYLSEVQYDRWVKLFGEFVPEAYVPRISAIFKESSQILKPSEPITFQTYEDLIKRPNYPMDKYIPVEIKISGKNELLKWKAGIITEARLPSYVRQIISHGLDIRPDGNVKNTNKYSFSVPPLKSAKDTLQQILRPFWVELAELRKQEGVNIQLNFLQPSSAADQQASSSTPQSDSLDSKSSDIIQQVNQFAASASPKEQLHLPSTLSSHARLLVHETAEKLGLQHTSTGTGKNRHVVLEKP